MASEKKPEKPKQSDARNSEEAANRRVRQAQDRGDTEPNWKGKCEVCGASPIVPLTGMCGPCTFGEAETINGNW